jgi:hypothetical protein
MIQIHYNIYCGKRNPRKPKILQILSRMQNLSSVPKTASIDKNIRFGV